MSYKFSSILKRAIKFYVNLKLCCTLNIVNKRQTSCILCNAKCRSWLFEMGIGWFKLNLGFIWFFFSVRTAQPSLRELLNLLLSIHQTLLFFLRFIIWEWPQITQTLINKWFVELWNCDFDQFYSFIHLCKCKISEFFPKTWYSINAFGQTTQKKHILYQILNQIKRFVEKFNQKQRHSIPTPLCV